MLNTVLEGICSVSISTTLVCHIHVFFETRQEDQRIVSRKMYEYVLTTVFWSYIYFQSMLDETPDTTPLTGPITLQSILLLQYAIVSVPFAKGILRWSKQSAL